jgi:NAD(P)H dehydrogenase (quinone)
MMVPLLHHGMVVVGIPYTEPDLNTTRSGGTPYGATHVSGTANDRPVTDEESRLAFALGARLARVAQKLAA